MRSECAALVPSCVPVTRKHVEDPHVPSAGEVMVKPRIKNKPNRAGLDESTRTRRARRSARSPDTWTSSSDRSPHPDGQVPGGQGETQFKNDGVESSGGQEVVRGGGCGGVR